MTRIARLHLEASVAEQRTPRDKPLATTRAIRQLTASFERRLAALESNTNLAALRLDALRQHEDLLDAVDLTPAPSHLSHRGCRSDLGHRPHRCQRAPARAAA